TYLAPHRTRLRVLNAIAEEPEEYLAELWDLVLPSREARRARRELGKLRRRDPHAVPFVRTWRRYSRRTQGSLSATSSPGSRRRPWRSQTVRWPSRRRVMDSAINERRSCAPVPTRWSLSAATVRRRVP